MESWADINLVFGGGWPPFEMNAMPIDELLRWHEIAEERSKAQSSAI
ncbi:GpE family phage tail protein [Candidatus Vondammii sp. HM_W22]|nr:GpE family phage tail protein [Candidatus Vondammii sp. HM_W22]